MFKVLDTSSLKELKYPEKLKGSWIYYVFFKNHPKLNGIMCVYFNNKFPSGTICVGDYILNDYPDVYGVWKGDDGLGNILSDRFSVSPILRKKGIGKELLIYGEKGFRYLFNKNLIHEYGNEIGNRLYSSAFKTDNVANSSADQAIDLREQFFYQPAQPYIFFGKRVVE
jgi:GNAT superfamily N-acetyltransferase